jgi:hypothetical protein
METSTQTDVQKPADVSAGNKTVCLLPLNLKGIRQSRPWIGRILIAAFSFVIMLGIVSAAIFALLARGPLEVPFLSERVALALEQSIGGGIDVDVGRTVLEKTDQGLVLHIYDVSLKNAQGQDIVRAPDALVSFDPLQLLRLSILPRKLALRGVQVRAEITENGDIVVSTGSAPASFTNLNATKSVDTAVKPDTPDVSARLTDAVAALAGLAKAGVVKNAGEAVFDALSIDESSLILEDRRNGKQLKFDRFTMAFDSQQSGFARIKGSIAKDNNVMPFDLTVHPTKDDIQFKAEISNIGDPVLNAALGQQTALFALNGGLTAKLEFTTDNAGKITTALAQLNLSPGNIAFSGTSNEPFDFNRGMLRANWKGDPTKIDDLTISLAGNSYQISSSGPVTLPTEAAPQFQYTASGENWKLIPLSLTDQPVTVDKVQGVFSLNRNLQLFKVENLTVNGPSTSLSLSGMVTKETDGPSLTLNVSANRMPARAALRWWPPFVASLARGFLVRTVQDGYLTKLKLAFVLPPSLVKMALNGEHIPAESLQLDGAIDGVSALILEGAPPIAGLSASGRVSTVSVQGTASAAYIDVRTGRRIQLTDGVINLSGFDTQNPQAKISFRNQGPLDGVAELFKLPALKGAVAVDIDPTTIKGQFDGRSTISFPLLANLKPSDLVPEFAANMTNMSIDKAIGRDKLENATLTVSGDKTGMEVKGEGRWQSLPVLVSFESDAKDKSLAAVLSFTMDDAALKRRGINLGSQLTGSFPVKIRTIREPNEAFKAVVEVDLVKVSTDGLIPGFQKPAGRAGKLTFDATEKPAGYSIQNIVLESGASSFRGQAETLSDGTITSAKFNPFRLSPGDSVRLDYERQNNGGKVVIRGNNFDARPFLKTTTSAGAANSTAANNNAEREIDLDLKTTLLSGYGGEVITNADIKMVRRAGQMKQLSLAGKLNGRTVTVGGRSVGEAAATLTIEADDAGGFLRFLDIYSRMNGGDLSGQILPSGKRLSGYFIARDFILRNEPALKRLSQQNNSDGVTPSNDNLSKFTKLRVDFSRDGNEITIKEAVIFGPQLGITFNGLLDQVKDRISLSGTFVPAYGLNNAFAQIPVLGSLLTGGRNEGVLAITFGVSGRASQPNVTVNPLSAVAPGIFRKIFEFRNDTSENRIPPQQPSPN